jgi:hypothetical protein
MNIANFRNKHLSPPLPYFIYPIVDVFVAAEIPKFQQPQESPNLGHNKPLENGRIYLEDSNLPLVFPEFKSRMLNRHKENFR